MLVQHFLENSAQKFADRNAVWYKDTWMNYSEIDTYANKLANYLLETGIKRGDRVAILFENSFNYIISYFAILKIGGVTVALNTDTNTDALVYVLNDSGAVAIVTQKKYSKYLIHALSKTPYLKEVIIDQDDLSDYEQVGHCNQIKLKEIYQTGIEKRNDVRSIDIDLASLVYTSGSTGKPKGVILTHLNIVTNTKSIVNYLKLSSQDRVMVVLPFYYIYGKSLLNTHFFVSGSVVIDNRFAYPNVIIKTMQDIEVTGFSGVPSTFMILLNKSVIKDQKLPNLRYVTQAGGAMAPSIQKRVAKAFTPAKLYIMYGATEAAARLSYLDPGHLAKKWGSIGKAIPNVELFIVDDRGNPLPPNQHGEIVARGLNIMQGYWNDQKGTNEVLRDGLYHTGDLGWMDEEGFFYVTGRKNEMIKVGGEKVSAKEVEEIILQLKKVQEVAVIGVADDILGEAIEAFVVPAAQTDIQAEEISNHCKRKLPQYKNPKFINIVTGLPKNKSGKILKAKLKNKK